MTGFIAAGVPAQIIRVSNTTLYRVAADYLGDALYWTRIALVNGLSDPWVDDLMELTIPVPNASGSPDGILGAWSLPVSSPVETVAPAQPVLPAGVTFDQILALLPYLPTELPNKPGVLWNNGGWLSQS